MCTHTSPPSPPHTHKTPHRTHHPLSQHHCPAARLAMHSRSRPGLCCPPTHQPTHPSPPRAPGTTACNPCPPPPPHTHTPQAKAPCSLVSRLSRSALVSHASVAKSVGRVASQLVFVFVCCCCCLLLHHSSSLRSPACARSTSSCAWVERGGRATQGGWEARAQPSVTSRAADAAPRPHTPASVLGQGF